MTSTMVVMAEPSVLYQLIEAKLDQPLTEFIAARRPYASWRSIADDIYLIAGVRVSREMLRRWFVDRITVEVKVA